MSVVTTPEITEQRGFRCNSAMWKDFKFTVARVLSRNVRERNIRLKIWELLFFNIVCDDILRPGYREVVADHICWWNRKLNPVYALCEACERDFQLITARGASSSPRP